MYVCVCVCVFVCVIVCVYTGPPTLTHTLREDDGDRKKCENSAKTLNANLGLQLERLIYQMIKGGLEREREREREIARERET